MCISRRHRRGRQLRAALMASRRWEGRMEGLVLCWAWGARDARRDEQLSTTAAAQTSHCCSPTRSAEPAPSNSIRQHQQAQVCEKEIKTGNVNFFSYLHALDPGVCGSSITTPKKRRMAWVSCGEGKPSLAHALAQCRWEGLTAVARGAAPETRARQLET